MDRRSFQLTLLAAMSTPALGQVNSAIDGPRGRFDDDLISNLEGRWKISRQIRGTSVENVADATWVLNHQFLQLHMKDVASPPKYEAIVLVGYVYSDKQYVAHWTDTFGAKFSAMGKGTRSGNSVEFRFEYQDGPFFNTFTWYPERKEWVLRMESQGPSGSRQLFATDTLSRLP
jgi:hypothetical protein